MAYFSFSVAVNHKYKETDRLHSVQSSLKFHSLWVLGNPVEYLCLHKNCTAWSFRGECKQTYCFSDGILSIFFLELKCRQYTYFVNIDKGVPSVFSLLYLTKNVQTELVA